MAIKCFKCKQELEQGASAPPVFRLMTTKHFMGMSFRNSHPHCLSCAREYAGNPWDDNKAEPTDYFLKADEPCPTCGTTFYMQKVNVFLPGNRYYVRKDDRIKYCSNQCSENRPRAVEHKTVLCKHCGEAFQQKRADSKYCSSKCRQRAYRERNK